MNFLNFNPDELLEKANPTNAINNALEPLIAIVTTLVIISIIVTVLVIAIWIYSLIRNRRVQSAIFDIQKTLNEMNERERLRGHSESTPRLAVTDTSESPKQA